MASPDDPTRSDNRRAALEMVTATFCFATMAAIAHGFGGIVSWPVVAFGRIALTAALTLAALQYMRAPLMIVGTPSMWGRSVTGSCALLCLFYSVSKLPVTDVVTVLATAPIWINILLVVVLRENVRKRIWLYAVLALIGVFVMHRPEFNSGAIPLAAALLGAMLMATAKIFLRNCSEIPTLSVVAHYALVASGITCVLCFTLVEQVYVGERIALAVWLWMLPMGLAGTLGQVFITLAYGRGNTAMVAIVGLGQIAFAACYDIFVWDNPFNAWKIAGIAIIGSSIFLTVTTNLKHPPPADGAPDTVA